MPLVPVHSPGDPRLDVYRDLTDRELLRTAGVFIAEGRHVVRRLLDGGRFAVQSLLLSPAAAADAADLLHAHPDVPAFVLPANQLDATAGFHVHRGCLAAAERGAPLGWRDVALAPGPVVVLEGIADPDNVGSIFKRVQSGEIRALAVLDTQRSKFLPAVPTTPELGMPNVISSSTRGIGAPRGTPAPIVKQLQDVLKKAMEDPEHVKKLEDSGLGLRIMVGDEYAKYYRETHEKAAKYTEWARSRPNR